MKDLTPDRDLARRAVEGDEASWREIYDATSDRLFSLLCYQTGNRQEARDLLQETYLSAIRRIGSYRGEAPLEVWLRAIALRKAIDWKRRVVQRLKRTAPLEEAERLPSSDPAPDHGIGTRSLHQALAKLSIRQRAALLLHEWEGRTFREIAEMLGADESTVRVHHARARARLRAALGPEPVLVRAADWEGQRS
jgi:RNA polymerase sigma-70 factor (ECF subfamily)